MIGSVVIPFILSPFYQLLEIKRNSTLMYEEVGKHAWNWAGGGARMWKGKLRFLDRTENSNLDKLAISVIAGCGIHSCSPCPAPIGT